MQKGYLKWLIAAVSAALVGLILIQLYWIDNAFGLRQDEMARSAQAALHEVVDQLERHETLQKLRSHQEAKYLFIEEEDSVNGPSFPPNDSLIEYVIKKKVENNGSKVEMRIWEEQDGRRKEKIITRSAKDLPYGKEMLTELEISLGEEREMFETLEPPVEGNSENINQLKQKLATKKTFVGDIVKSLIEVNLNERIEDRVNPRIIDSLLMIAMHEQGLDVKFEASVIDEKDQVLFGAFDPKDGDKAELQARLFPNDIIGSPYFLTVHFPNQNSYLIREMWVLLLASLIFTLAIIATFYFAVSTIVRQKKYSAIKNDFINNMTHELKTPISTISLACEALSDPELSKLENIKKRYVGIINDENKRLGLLVEEVLQSAVLDKAGFKLKKEDLNFHQLLEEVVDKYQIQIKERAGSLKLELNAEQTNVSVDKTHLTNVIYNLLDNANKYSKSAPDITIRTESKNGQLVVSVSDKGIGISKDNLKKVFDKLYRVPTGNVHNIKGFGLGLSYVKIIAERHGGCVSAESTPGVGSTFFVELPLIGNIDNHGSSRKAA